MEKKKFTLRQKWFPNYDDAVEITNQKEETCDYKKDYSYLFQLFGRWARTLFLSGALIWGGYQGIGNNIKYSEGTRTGMINKISEKGLIWKTSEGQIALEGIVSGNNMIGANVWDFSIDRQSRHGENKKELVKKMRKYIDSGTKVKVDYIEPLTTWPWRSETDYLIQSIETVEKK